MIKVLWTVSTNKNEKRLLTTESKKRTIGWDIHKWQIKNTINRKLSEITRWNTDNGMIVVKQVAVIDLI